jgi:hypothetical protein
MTPEQIKEKVGQPVTEAEMVDMLKTNPIGTSDRDVMVRSGVLRFSFGPRGVKLIGAEVRNPLPDKAKVTGSPALSASPSGLPGSAAGDNEAP